MMQQENRAAAIRRHPFSARANERPIKNALPSRAVLLSLSLRLNSRSRTPLRAAYASVKKIEVKILSKGRGKGEKEEACEEDAREFCVPRTS